MNETENDLNYCRACGDLTRQPWLCLACSAEDDALREKATVIGILAVIATIVVILVLRAG